MSTIQERLRQRKVKGRIRLAHPYGTLFGVIIVQPSGAFYTHETGGYSCRWELAEGVFAPLRRSPDEDQELLLSTYFTGPKWNGWCSDGIDEATADYVDHVMSLSPESSFIKVDRTRLPDSKEAWIYVNVHEPVEFPDNAPLYGFGECQGILVWRNSD